MRNLRILGALGISVALVSGAAFAVEKQPTVAPVQDAKSATIQQKTCPVMGGGAIDTAVYTDHQGKRVYFCCEGCIAPFKKDPAKYLKILADKGEVVRVVDSSKASNAPQASKSAPQTSSTDVPSGAAPQLRQQTTCPVMTGGAIDKKVYEDYKGQRIYFCCEGCRAPFKKDPETYLKKMRKNGEKPEAL